MSIFDIIEDLNIGTETTQVNLPVQILGSVRREAEVDKIEKSAVIEILNPSGKAVYKQTLPITLEAQHTRCRMRLGIILPLTETGKYMFSFCLDDKKKETIINVNLTPLNINPHVVAPLPANQG